jgi:hypothetical protein
MPLKGDGTMEYDEHVHELVVRALREERDWLSDAMCQPDALHNMLVPMLYEEMEHEGLQKPFHHSKDTVLCAALTSLLSLAGEPARRIMAHLLKEQEEEWDEAARRPQG